MELITKIFDLKISTSYDLNALEQVDSTNPKAIRYVSRTKKNNGVSSYVLKRETFVIQQPHTITVPLVGSVLEAKYQDKNYITSQNIMILTPIQELEIREMIFYAAYIRKLADDFNYGRTGHSRFKTILVPEKHEIPSWVYEVEIPDYSDVKKSFLDEQVELPSGENWGTFTFSEIFEMTRGRGGTATNAKNNPGNNRYIGASAENNGITQFTSLSPTEKGNSITVANNGAVGASFYQPQNFLATSDVTVLTLKERELNPYIALFLTTLIQQIGESFDYGRKWGINRMKESKISLPIDSNGKPDWQLMEDYIKSLPYSKYL